MIRVLDTTKLELVVVCGVIKVAEVKGGGGEIRVPPFVAVDSEGVFLVGVVKDLADCSSHRYFPTACGLGFLHRVFL